MEVSPLVSYILRCSCHEGQPSRIRNLLHHAIVVALYPIQHKNQTLIQPNSNSPTIRRHQETATNHEGLYDRCPKAL
eukprot:jgi/Chrzof1/10863/Cz05g15060.t1